MKPGGCWGGPGLGPHTKSDAKRGGRPWQLWGGEGGVICSPGQRIGAPLFLPPCPLARNLTLSVLRNPSFPDSFRGYPRPGSYLSPALPPTCTPKTSLPSPRTPGMCTLAAPRSPARGLTSSGVRRAESTRGQRGAAAHSLPASVGAGQPEGQEAHPGPLQTWGQPAGAGPSRARQRATSKALTFTQFRPVLFIQGLSLKGCRALSGRIC